MAGKIIYKSMYTLLLALSIALAAAGCAKKPDPIGATHSAKEEMTTGSAVEEEAKESTEESAKESRENPRLMPELKSEEEIGSMRGIVREAGMNTMVIASEEYPDGVVFAKEDAAVSLEKGLNMEQEVTVFYRGKINLASSSGSKAELVRDPRAGDEERRAGVISGEVLSIGMSVITIKVKDGGEISFEQDPKPVNLTKGPSIGEEVTVLYSYKEGERIYVPELIIRK